MGTRTSRKTRLPKIRSGIGYDIHRLVPGRSLVLGTIRIPSPVGLLGHSDADALSHAICDALLGAAALGDIGEHFPDTSRKWKGASGKLLLAHVARLIAKSGYTITNIDATVVLESPKIGPYKRRMEGSIARALSVSSSAISVKATTHERLGSLGRSEGCAALAIATIQRSED